MSSVNKEVCEFSELSKRSQLLAIGNYIKGWRKIHKESDITVDEARKLCSCEKCKLMYYSDGKINTNIFILAT